MRRTNHGLQKICTCPRQRWPKCRHSWHFAYKWGGHHFRFSLDKHLGRHLDSKTEAESEAEKIRLEIRAGQFGRPAPTDAMTLQHLVDVYLERYVLVEHADAVDDFRSGLRVICGTPLPHPTGGRFPFGAWRLTDVKTDTIERYRETRRAGGTGVGGTNRSLGRLRAVYNWAVRMGYVEASPFKRGGEPVVRLSREIPRTRRLNPDIDEEAALLAQCGPHLRAVVECALEAGMRRSEILSLVWRQVEGMLIDGSSATWAPRAALVLWFTKTKTRRERRIPISSRLKAILELRRFSPSGDPLPVSSYVFGTEIGQPVKDIKRAWNSVVLRAHGGKPRYTSTANLTLKSREALAGIDLHFHDLRRECGSRWLEGGVPLHTVRDCLGHTTIAQTSTYLAGTMQTQHDAMRQFEERRATLQELVTDSRTGGRKSPRTDHHVTSFATRRSWVRAPCGPPFNTL